MLRPSFILIFAGCLLAGCTSVKQSRQPAHDELEAMHQLLARTYSAEELGIQFTDQTGQTIRWKETISPRSTVTLPLLPAESSMALQPRILARVNQGDPVPFSIDTGASMNVLGAVTALAAKVKVANPDVFKNTFRGVAGTEENYYGVIDELRAEPLLLRNVLTVLRAEKEGLEQRLDNVLGMTSLAKFAWFTIDYPRKQAVFAADGKYDPPAGSRSIPFKFSAFQIQLEAAVNDTYSVTIMLDTGNDSNLMLPRSVVEQIGLLDEAKKGAKSKFAGIGGTMEAHRFTIKKVALGEQTFENVEAVMVPDEFPPSIGSGLFQQMLLAVDFRKMQLWVSDSKSLAKE